MNREVITIGVGGAGCRMAYQFWRRIMAEHGIGSDGRQRQGFAPPPKTFFEQAGAGRFIPRALFVDLDDSLRAELEQGELTDVLHPDYTLSGSKGPASGNFARGRSADRKLIDKVDDRVRKLVDNSDNVQGFILFHALPGGTGSGLGTVLLERLGVDYRKKSRLSFTLMPSAALRRDFSEYHNAVLGLSELVEHSEVSFVFDNQAMHDICIKSLGVKRPGFEHLNELISRAASDVTAGMRFENAGPLVDLSAFQTKLVPYPRLHFMTLSLAHLASKEQAQTLEDDLPSMSEMVVNPRRSCLASLSGFDPGEDEYMAALLIYRGALESKEVNAAAQWLKTNRKLSFAQGTSGGLLTGICEVPTGTLRGDHVAAFPRTVTMIGNPLYVSKYFSKGVTEHFDEMFAERAFVHSYEKAGVDGDAFISARTQLEQLSKDYLEVRDTSQADPNA